jgi:hypothetical protein
MRFLAPDPEEFEELKANGDLMKRSWKKDQILTALSPNFSSMLTLVKKSRRSYQKKYLGR